MLLTNNKCYPINVNPLSTQGTLPRWRDVARLLYPTDLPKDSYKLVLVYGLQLQVAGMCCANQVDVLGVVPGHARIIDGEKLRAIGARESAVADGTSTKARSSRWSPRRKLWQATHSVPVVG